MRINTAKMFLVFIVILFVAIMTWTIVNLVQRSGDIVYESVVLGLCIPGIVLAAIVFYQSTCSFL